LLKNVGGVLRIRSADSSDFAIGKQYWKTLDTEPVDQFLTLLILHFDELQLNALLFADRLPDIPGFQTTGPLSRYKQLQLHCRVTPACNKSTRYSVADKVC